jgi:DNA modification methylase
MSYQMKLRQVSVSALVTDPNNARKHDARNIEAIRKSLELFGQRKPIVTAKGNDGSLVVIAGNGTLEAARLLGWEKITVAEVPDDWDADKARAYALADNRTAELADWDETVLAGALIDLDAVGWDIADLGFDPIEPPVDTDELDDQDITPPADPYSKLGDLWLLGKNHRVLCGDASEEKNYERLIDGKADIVWTDPPYGVEYVGKTKDALTIQNDNLKGKSLRAFLAETLTPAHAATKNGGVWYLAAPSGDLFYEFATVLMDLKIWRHTLVWIKDMFVMGRADYHYRHESIFYGWKEGAAHVWNGGRKQDSVIEVARPKRNAEHPTMKPIALIVRCLENSSNPGDLVLDPFAGSGSTMLAAHATGRRSALIELDPRYVDVICRRYQAATGDLPVNAATGEPHDFGVEGDG